MKGPYKFQSINLIPSLAEARAWLLEMNATGPGAICPCCKQLDKVYNRPVSLSVVRVLANLYRYTRVNGPGYYHYTAFQEIQVGRDFPCLLRFIDLIDRAENTNPKQKTSGMYKITETGEAFVENRISIPERLLVYHDELIGTVGAPKFIGEFWPDFDYEKLMSEPAK